MTYPRSKVPRLAPADVEGTARALYEALTMPSEERAVRSRKMAKGIEQADITDWLYRQLADVNALAD